MARGHWTIENKSHYVRDGVALGEDASRIRKGSGPQVMAALRRPREWGILQGRTGVANIAEALRRNAARVDDLFAKLGILKR